MASVTLFHGSDVQQPQQSRENMTCLEDSFAGSNNLSRFIIKGEEESSSMFRAAC